MTMLERAAKAAWKNHCSGNHLFGGPPQDEDWSDLTVQQKAALCTLVAAVLRAIREPDEAMVREGRRALKVHIDGLSAEERASGGPRSPGDYPGYRVQADLKYKLRWQAMIDVVLKEGASDG